MHERSLPTDRELLEQWKAKHFMLMLENDALKKERGSLVWEISQLKKSYARMVKRKDNQIKKLKET